MQTKHVVVAICLGLILFIAGIAGGIWFTTHYKIVPANAPPTAAEPLALPMPPAPPKPEDFEPAPEPSASTGLFSYKFTPNERLSYRLNAEIGGTGLDLGEGSAINMSMGSDISLLTEAVDTTGAGDLKMLFDQVDMTGSFMGSPIEVHDSPSRTTAQLDDRTRIDTQRGDSTKGIPQLDFFRKPVRMKVAKDGEVLRVAGARGMEQMLTSLMKVPGTELPSAEAQPGYQWDSTFKMPVPGFGTAVDAVAHNTLTGYTQIDGRQCAVVEQIIESEQTGGTLNSPESLLGPEMQFAMPSFRLDGRNTVYFDTAEGKLVRTDLDLDIGLEIGGQLNELASTIIGAYSEALGGAENPRMAPPKQPQPKNLELGVNVKATLDLVGQGQLPDKPIN